MDLTEKLEQLTQITAALTNEVIGLRGKDLITRFNELEEEHTGLQNDIEDLGKRLKEQQNEILSLVKQQGVKFERLLSLARTTPHQASSPKISKYFKMFPIKALKDMDAMEKLINENNINELVAVVKQLLMPQGIIKNIDAVLSVKCIKAYNLDGQHSKRRLLDQKKFMDLLFRAAYYDGYSYKRFLEEVCQGLKMVQNRYSRLQIQNTTQTEEEQVENIPHNLEETEEHQYEDITDNREIFIKTEVHHNEEITNNREVFIIIEKHQDKEMTNHYLNKCIKTEVEEHDEEITDNLEVFNVIEYQQDEEVNHNLEGIIKTEEHQYEEISNNLKFVTKKEMESKKDIIKKILMSRRFLITSKLMEETSLCVQNLLNLQEKYLLLLKELHLLSSMKLSLNSGKLSRQLEKNLSFWEIDCQQANDTFFKNNFRMKRETFNKLCKILRGLRKINTNMREAIPLEKRVAIALYALGSSAEYRTIGNMFNVGKTTVGGILLNFIEEVWRVLAPMYLKNFPLTKEKVEELTREFEALGLPQCIGALDTCHIEIHPIPTDPIGPTYYYNCEGWYSIVLLALVDARCRFTYVSCGSPGRCNDSKIFEESSLKQQLDQCSLLNDLSKTIAGVDVPLFVAGDSAFKLSDKLMKPYTLQESQNLQQKCFNYALSKANSVATNAFKQLKARFMRIGIGIDNAIRTANTIILAGCTLHNFLNDNNDTCNEEWLQALEATEACRFYPEHNVTLTGESSAQNPESIRQAISNHLSVDVDGISVGINDDDGDAFTGIGDDDNCEVSIMVGDGNGDVTGTDGGEDAGCDMLVSNNC